MEKGSSEMAQQAKVLVMKPDNVSFIPGAHMEEREK